MSQFVDTDVARNGLIAAVINSSCLRSPVGDCAGAVGAHDNVCRPTLHPRIDYRIYDSRRPKPT